MKIIDSHTHPEFNDSTLKKVAKENRINFSYEGVIKEMRQNCVERIVGIATRTESNELIANLMQKDKRILAIKFVSAFISRKELTILNKELKEEKFKGIKLLPGYEYFYPNEKKCNKIYKIAEENNVPVIFHSGDTWSAIKKAKVKYAHPIYIDDVAVENPKLKIVIAHSGNPWIVDAAEVAYKNENVFLDISGWFLKKVDKTYANIMKKNLNFIVGYADFDKIMFGTDWPLIRMEPYINFIKKSGIKGRNLRKAMYKNALKLFWKS